MNVDKLTRTRYLSSVPSRAIPEVFEDIDLTVFTPHCVVCSLLSFSLIYMYDFAVSPVTSLA